MGFSFQGLNEAKVYGKGTFLGVGFYELEIQNVIGTATERSGDCVIVEFKVTKSNNENHPVGSKASYVQKLADKTIAWPELKKFCLCALGVDPGNVELVAQMSKDPELNPEALLKGAIDGGKMNGMKLAARVEKYTTKKNKREIDKLSFEPLAAG